MGICVEVSATRACMRQQVGLLFVLRILVLGHCALGANACLCFLNYYASHTNRLAEEINIDRRQWFILSDKISSIQLT